MCNIQVVRTVVDIVLWFTVLGCIVALNVFQKPGRGGFFCNDETIRYKFQRSTVSLTTLLCTSVLVPILLAFGVELIEGFRDTTRNKLDTLRRCVVTSLQVSGMLLYGLVVTVYVTDFVKKTTLRPRPHFIDTCRPDWSSINCSQGFITNYNCTNTRLHRLQILDAQHSFPSGHASLSAYASFYLVFYMQFRLRPVPFSYLLKSVIQLGLVTWAVYCGLSRITDHRHHWTDVLAGSLLGILLAAWTSYGLSNKLKGNIDTDEREAKGGLFQLKEVTVHHDSF